jgi:hypothetical protein
MYTLNILIEKENANKKEELPKLNCLLLCPRWEYMHIITGG